MYSVGAGGSACVSTGSTSAQSARLSGFAPEILWPSWYITTPPVTSEPVPDVVGIVTSRYGLGGHRLDLPAGRRRPAEAADRRARGGHDPGALRGVERRAAADRDDDVAARRPQRRAARLDGLGGRLLARDLVDHRAGRHRRVGDVRVEHDERPRQAGVGEDLRQLGGDAVAEPDPHRQEVRRTRPRRSWPRHLVAVGGVDAGADAGRRRRRRRSAPPAPASRRSGGGTRTAPSRRSRAAAAGRAWRGSRSSTAAPARRRPASPSRGRGRPAPAPGSPGRSGRCRSPLPNTKAWPPWWWETSDRYATAGSSTRSRTRWSAVVPVRPWPGSTCVTPCSASSGITARRGGAGPVHDPASNPAARSSRGRALQRARFGVGTTSRASASYSSAGNVVMPANRAPSSSSMAARHRHHVGGVEAALLVAVERVAVGHDPRQQRLRAPGPGGRRGRLAGLVVRVHRPHVGRHRSGPVGLGERHLHQVPEVRDVRAGRHHRPGVGHVDADAAVDAAGADRGDERRVAPDLLRHREDLDARAGRPRCAARARSPRTASRSST